MPTTTSFTGGESVYSVDNLSFDGTPRGGKMITDGQLWIGSTASDRPNDGGHVRLGSLTSPGGTITIGYASPNITLDLAGGTTAIDSIGVDTTTGTGTNPVLPTAAGLVTVTGGQYPTGTFGTRVITLNSQSPNNYEVLAQISSTNATSLITKNGICHFDSTSFSVDANGFVTLAGGGFTWNDVSGAFSPLKDNGYFITGTATGTLPAAPSQGDTIKFFVDHASQVLTLQATGSQKIRLGTLISSAAGTAVSTLQGDSVELVYRSSDTCWCAVCGFSGTWVMA